MLRNHLLFIFCLLICGTAAAGNPFPAVDLPAVVPEQVRDRTARELAATRDRLGWAIQPFRGEFHGLGTPAEGVSRATDLSADGRVVVGADQSGSSSEAFVWSPWTGRAHYDVTPAGLSGRTTATSISGDGVYVAGDVTVASPDSIDASLIWSLAGKQQVASPDFEHVRDLTLSGDGGVVVGTLSNQPLFNPDLNSSQYEPSIERAFRTSRGGTPEALAVPNGYDRSEAVDVSNDGESVLGNAFLAANYPSGSEVFSPQTQPILWRDGQAIPLGGLAQPYFPPSRPSLYRYTQITTASVISADGSTIAGAEIFIANRSFFQSIDIAAILWREETGWIDIGSLSRTADVRPPHWYDITGISGDGGRVVGTARFGLSIANADYTAFLWDEQRGMRDLAEVLSLDYGLDLGDWDLGRATAISEDGTTIIGNGTNPSGRGEAWRAVLERNTPDGDLDFDGDVDDLDYQTLVDNLGLTSESRAVYYASGDLNADGLVDESDLASMMSLYREPLSGDYNLDGLINAADYTLWRDWFGSIDLPQIVAQSRAWRDNFGRRIGSLAGLIPEPTAAALLAVTLGWALRPTRGR